jgi:hypothetical protein
VLSWVDALVHLSVVPEHFETWWGYGLFFVATAGAQLAYGAALLRWPRRGLFLLGTAGSLFLLALYVMSRTLGIPLVGPQAGEVEDVATLDLVSKSVEVLLVIALGLLWRARSVSRRRER